MSKRKAGAETQADSTLSTVLSLVETLTAEELVQVIDKVKVLQKGLPLVLPKLPEELEFLKDKFTIFDKGCEDDSHDFDDIFADSVHSYKLVWSNGDEMDLKVVNQRGVMHAGSTSYEVQGVQVGPLLIMASFPDESRLPKSTTKDFEDSIPEFVAACKSHGVEFGSYRLMSSFIVWLLNDVMEGPTEYVRYVVDYGALAKAYGYYKN